MIHGTDVSRAILAVHWQISKAAGQRWLLTDLRTHDWWDLVSAWGDSKQQSWVRELLDESAVHALPRSANMMRRGLDSREFWTTFGLSPIMSMLD